MSNDQIKARLRKLLELARRGEGGEAETADKFLRKLLARHGLTLSDLDDEGTVAVRREFKFKGKDEEQLLTQIFCRILRSGEISAGIYRGSYVISLTPGQHIEAELMVGPLLKDYRKQKKNLLNAFVVANRLFSGQASEDDDGTTLSAEELDAILRMAGGMNPVVIPRGALEHRS